MIQQTPIPGSDRVRSTLEEVLASPDFAEPGRSIMARVVDALQDLIRNVFERWIPALGEAQVRALSWLLVIVVTGIVLVAVWRWTVAAAGTAPRRRRRPEPVTVGRDAAAWVAWARAEAREGRARSAATGLYQAVILELEAAGALRFGEWKTPGDYALEIPPSSDRHGPFRSFLASFVELAFGPDEPSSDAVEGLFAHAEKLGCRT